MTSKDVMAMEHEEAELNTSINTTPLVDVMLVLLIIFLITVPVVIKTVRSATAESHKHTDDHKAGKYHHRGGQGRERLLEQRAAWQQCRSARHGLSRKPCSNRQPEVHIRGDKEVRFEAVGRVVLDCQRAGILKVGFLTEPEHLGNGS